MLLFRLYECSNATTEEASKISDLDSAASLSLSFLSGIEIDTFYLYEASLALREFPVSLQTRSMFANAMVAASGAPAAGWLAG